MNETQKEKFDKIQRSLNPKTKVRNVFKIESDGTKTKARVIDTGDRAIFHCEKGPALVNYKDLSLTRFPNIHFVGDALSARGITVSGAQGTYVAEAILKN